ncbi:N-6 DNA methylase [Streptomyces sp. NPDC127098]|uniref:N-6 DNA methylase n=1 Tax=Streptomyces sp. NPDC127098 TaxID=3347137 RepID=UPI003661DE1A
MRITRGVFDCSNVLSEPTPNACGRKGMSMSESGHEERLMTRSEIARVAGVGRPTVTNWQRRHPGFPRPERNGDDEYFHRSAVLSWLDSRVVPIHLRAEEDAPGGTYGDRARRAMGLAVTLSPAHETSGPETVVTDPEPQSAQSANEQAVAELLGGLADRVRGPATMVDYLSLLLSLNFLCAKGGPPWATVETLVDTGSGRDGATALLRHIGTATDGELRRIGVLPGMAQVFSRLEPRSMGDLVRAVRLVERCGRGAFRLILDEYEGQAGLRSTQFFTPRGVAQLIADLTVAGWHGPPPTLYDFYTRGGELLAEATARLVAKPGSPAPVVVGDSPHQDTLRLATMNLALQGARPRLQFTRDSWRPHTRARVSADLVLTNPPFNMSDSSGEARDGADWAYGAPPVGNDNFAHVQHALAALREGGRAVIVMPNKAGNSVNRAERLIRGNMVEAGVVESVLALPPRLFSSTDVPVSLWFLRHPAQPRDEVLFLDARDLGTRRRGRNVLAEGDREAIVAAMRRRGGEGVVTGGVVGRGRLREQGYSLTPSDYTSVTRQPPAHSFTCKPPTPSRKPPLTEALDEVARQQAHAAEADREAADAGVPPLELILPPEGQRVGLPRGWSRVELRQLCHIKAGPSYTRLPADRRIAHGDVPVVFPRHLKGGRISDTDQVRVSAEDARRLDGFRLVTGDILCVRTGSLVPPAMVRSAQDGWLQSTNLLRLRRHDHAEVDPGYLLDYLARPDVMEWIRNRSAATAAPSISADSLGHLPVLLPPLAAQRDIRRSLASLEAQARAHQRLALAVRHARLTLAEQFVAGGLGHE